MLRKLKLIGYSVASAAIIFVAAKSAIKYMDREPVVVINQTKESTKIPEKKITTELLVKILSKQQVLDLAKRFNIPVVVTHKTGTGASASTEPPTDKKTTTVSELDKKEIRKIKKDENFDIDLAGEFLGIYPVPEMPDGGEVGAWLTDGKLNLSFDEKPKLGKLPNKVELFVQGFYQIEQSKTGDFIKPINGWDISGGAYYDSASFSKLHLKPGVEIGYNQIGRLYAKAGLRFSIIKELGKKNETNR